jgi:hypothetical protein
LYLAIVDIRPPVGVFYGSVIPFVDTFSMPGVFTKRDCVQPALDMKFVEEWVETSIHALY